MTCCFFVEWKPRKRLHHLLTMCCSIRLFLALGWVGGGLFMFSALAHMFYSTQEHRLREMLTFLDCPHMSHATKYCGFRHIFLVLHLHLCVLHCLTDVHVSLVMLPVFDLAHMFDAMQVCTSSSGDVNVL